MKDIQTQQQMQQSGMYRKRRRREKREKRADLLQEGGKVMERVVDFFCMAILILFILIFVVGALFFIGMAIYFHSELNQDSYKEVYTERQRMEDETQMQALKEDAERRAAKKREKEERRKRKRWKKRNF